MKVGDRVVMSKEGELSYPKTTFRTGVVKEVAYGMVRVKRDYYRGHEYTWWYKSEWYSPKGFTKVVKNLAERRIK